MTILQQGRPPDWEQLKMTAYFETMWANTLATFAKKEEVHRLCRIDELLSDIGDGWSGGSLTVQSIVPLMMFFRSHSSFRGACALGMGGATVEGFTVLRQCLEFAGYAALVHGDPALARLWWDRDKSEADEKKVRRSFTHAAVTTAVDNLDPALPTIYDTLYDRVIQFGAHPNEKSISGNLKFDIAEAETKLSQMYLQGDGQQLDHWIRTPNQVGIMMLKIFEKIHSARFAAIGAAPRIDVLARDL
jgi:FAD/FMN-containing dehydrogenase